MKERAGHHESIIYIIYPMIRILLTGYGRWEYHVQANNSESDTNNAWARPAFAGQKLGECRRDLLL